ncbi:MAG: hypothetical protein BWY76_03290 [bacterium ADurb.Bin429]|nr:MAG: hypothetical protein BWY76_03290 [bacterium ADurb.Bin429]
MQPHRVHKAVCDVGRAGHVTGVFEEAQHGEEDHQDRQERHHHSRAANKAIGEQIDRPVRERALQRVVERLRALPDQCIQPAL